MLEALTETLKKAAAALEAEQVPFMLGGGLGCWARGGPPSINDVDLMIRPEDADRAQDALKAAGMRAESPPEQWLVKAWDGDVLVDLIYEPVGVRIDDEAFGRAEELNVAAMVMPVMALDDIIVTKLFALDEHSADFGDLLLIARALREQIDWPALRARVSGTPFGDAFLALAEGLGIAAGSEPAEAQPARSP
jgi:Uncharacterised nucleotidyltransferase